MIKKKKTLQNKLVKVLFGFDNGANTDLIYKKNGNLLLKLKL